MKLYADDTNLFVCGSNLQSVVDETNILLSKLNKWFIVNKLSLSLEKTCYMVFGLTENHGDIVSCTLRRNQIAED